ncbi:Fpg/Nei family DNA glycosylase [Subtercola sp. YIM 133946]|uniref:Fpg/Nei family DNA glycosylase n=1 Tax=Subtercola sp. YIM 133946 TaxID=3118909 RepID=UPI002F954B65
MPELPEVYALVADLGARLVGRTLDRFDVVSFAALKTFDPPASALAGRMIVAVDRHGKFLDLTFAAPGAGVAAGGDDELHLVMHLARAGWIRWREGPPVIKAGRPGSGPLAARLVLDESGDPPGSGLDITEAGTKKSLAIYVVRDPNEVPGIARLGPNPLDPGFTLEQFAGILNGAGRAQIKGVLRNQAVIAGIGNAYSDEILHTAHMSPFKPAAMTDDEVGRLFEAMQSTLRGAIERSDGLAASELKREKKLGLQVHGRTGEFCPVCGDIVRQVTYADSSLQYCPTCQTGGKPLADRVLSRLLK